MRLPSEPHACLQSALARRETRAPPFPVEAFRVANGSGDGAPPGLTVDRYARWVVVAARAHLDAGEVESWTRAAWDVLRPEGLVLKRLAFRVTESTTRVWRGRVPEHPIPVREADVTLLAYLNDGVHTGVFLDQRETRWRARAFAAGQDVLNLFAYTGAFSVHAACAGARRVTSVDVSKKALGRARENLRASGVDPDMHRWFADDVMAHLRRAPPEGYGLVIVDPPVFGRGGRRPFALLRDLEHLLTLSFATMRRGGTMFVSAHARALDRDRVDRALHRAARAVRRRVEILDWLGLPAWDHPVPGAGRVAGRVAGRGPSADRGDYLVTAVVRSLS